MRLVVLPLLVAAALTATLAPPAGAQTPVLNKEYIYLGGRLIATESPVSTETVSPPTVPAVSGTCSGVVGAVCTFSTGGSTSSLGHAVQYQFTWGDGQNSGWLAASTTTASHSWSAAGTYTVTAQARCVADTGAVSSASPARSQVITAAPTIVVTVSPASANLGPSQTQQFSASVTGTTDTVVTWSISPNTGTITTSGGLYTAPSTISSTQTVTVTATSHADSSKKGTATVTLVPSLTVSPGSVTLLWWQTQTFTAAGAPSVTWSVDSGGTGSITSGGVYSNANSSASTRSATVRATSTVSPNPSATALVTVSANQVPSPGAMSPSSGTGYRRTFTFAMSDPNGYADMSEMQVVFASGSSVANTPTCHFDLNRVYKLLNLVDQAGNLVSPTNTVLGSANTLTNGYCTVYMATSSQSDSGTTTTLTVDIEFNPVTFSGTKTVFVVAADRAAALSGYQQKGTWSILPVAISAVSPASVSLGPGQSQQFAATVTNTPNTAVTWSRSPASGTISASGLYTAPSSITSTQTVTVTAVAQADTSKSSTATVTLTPPPVVVTVSPSSASRLWWQTQQFTATVTGITPTTVTWGVPAGTGSVSAAGLYSNSASSTSARTATVRATSTAAPAKYADAAVSVPANQPPTPTSVSPASGSGHRRTFTFVMTDANGYADMKELQGYFSPNSSPYTTPNCHFHLNRIYKLLNLYDQAGNLVTPTNTVLGSATTLTNGYCSIYMGTSSQTDSGNTTTLVLDIEFNSSTFAGAKNVFMLPVDYAGWASPVQKGTWTAQ